MLLQHGTPHDHETNDGHTALTLACAKGHLTTVGALLQHGAYVDKETRVGLTPLIAAVESDQSEVISALAACGAQLDYETERDPRSALTAAAGTSPPHPPQLSRLKLVVCFKGYWPLTTTFTFTWCTGTQP